MQTFDSFPPPPPQVLETATQKQTEEGVQSTLKVTVGSDITAVCNATNEFGSDAVTYNIKASEFGFPLRLWVLLLVSVSFVAPPPNPHFLSFSQPLPPPSIGED